MQPTNISPTACLTRFQQDLIDKLSLGQTHNCLTACNSFILGNTPTDPVWSVLGIPGCTAPSMSLSLIFHFIQFVAFPLFLTPLLFSSLLSSLPHTRPDQTYLLAFNFHPKAQRIIGQPVNCPRSRFPKPTPGTRPVVADKANQTSPN